MLQIKWLLFDWGDTLMYDNPEYKGESYLWPDVQSMPGVAELMPELSKNYKCAVVSNAKDSNADTMKMAFERMNIEKYFSFFITSKEIGYNKPDERFFIEISYRLQTPLSELCMIGNDYEKDIVSSKRLGMKTILINQQDGEYPMADMRVKDFTSLKFCFNA